MWSVEVPIFDNEDEAKLKASFVELSARYKDYPAADIAREVFKGLVDCDSRASQASILWGNSLEIKERIRRCRENNGKEPTPMTEEEEHLAWVKSQSRNDELTPSAQFKYAELYARMKGYIKDTVDPKADSNTKRQLPQMVITRYDS